MKDAILDFALKHKATKISQALRDFKLLDTIDWKLTMVFIPTDEAVDTFLKTIKVDYNTIKNHPTFAEIIKNHYSILPTKKVYPMFTAVSGLPYGNSQKDIESLGAKEVLILDRYDALKVPVISISTLFFTPNQRNTLEKVGPANLPKKK